MPDSVIFAFSDYWWFYAGFSAFVLALLALDLGVFHKESHRVSFKEAGIWSVVWVALALLFNYGFYRFALYTFTGDPQLAGLGALEPAAAARQIGLEFLTGYVVEKSLAIDNIFVFVVVFTFFGIPEKYQHRVLFYGIIGALAFRAIFIAMGSVLLQYEWIVYLFGAFLILTGIKMFFAPDKPIDPGKNPILRLFRRFVPLTPDLHGQRFWVRLDGRLHATPLMVSLVFLELSDVIFAVDSVPAIFALTNEPLIVFTSNVFAILGLRAMYFLLAGAVDLFHLLKFGLAIVLIFVGLKMVWLNEAFDGKFPITWSLAIILSVIVATIGLSLAFPKKAKP